MFNPLLFIECPERVLLSQRTCGVFTERVVSFGDLHFWKEKFVFKGLKLYLLYKEGRQAGGRASKEGAGKHNTIVKCVHELL